MKKIILLSIIFSANFLWAQTHRPLDNYFLEGKRLHWQDHKKANRYYLDFEGNGQVDRMDVMLEDGVDFYSEMGKKGYSKKVRVRYFDNTIKEEFQERKGRVWKTIREKTISKISPSEIDYEMWIGDKENKNGFKERLDSSSLMLEGPMCSFPKKKEVLDFSGLNAVINNFHSTFHFDQSCIEGCKGLIKKFDLKIQASSSSCKFLFEKMASSALDNTLSCLVKSKTIKDVGPDIAHRILGGLRYRGEKNQDGQGHIQVSCVHNKKFIAKTFGIFPGETRHVTIDLGDFISGKDVSLEDQFKSNFGHELYHIGGYFHMRNEVDVSYACNECCNSNDTLSCQICNRSKNVQMEDVDYLMAALMYEKYIGPDKEFRVYHKAIEKLHEVIQHENFFENFEKKISLSKGEIVEKFYFQLTTHIRNPVDNRGEDKLRYSDMIAEIMAKINCSEVGRMPSDQRTVQDRYGCEVMYLARSIPSSYCYQRKSKQSCVEAIRLRYSRMKQVDRTGIPIPDNFLSLDQAGN